MQIYLFFPNTRAACLAHLAIDVNTVEFCEKNTLFFECLTMKSDALPSSETSETAHPTAHHLSETSASVLYESQISHSKTNYRLLAYDFFPPPVILFTLEPNIFISLFSSTNFFFLQNRTSIIHIQNKSNLHNLEHNPVQSTLFGAQSSPIYIIWGTVQSNLHYLEHNPVQST